jgi:putative ABC transport system permease protein
MYAGELMLVAALLGGLVLLLGVLGLLGWGMVALLRRVKGGGNSWRLAWWAYIGTDVPAWRRWRFLP